MNASIVLIVVGIVLAAISESSFNDQPSVRKWFGIFAILLVAVGVLNLTAYVLTGHFLAF